MSLKLRKKKSMNKTLHFFCSKEAQAIFNNSTLDGDSLLFDEKLTEGELAADVFSDEFWAKRYEYFEKKYHTSKLEYFDAVIKPILQLKDLSDYTEVTLWLDFTKESQVNLIALGTYLANNFLKETQYNLVCSGKHKGRNELQKLTNYNSEEFKILYSYKVKLTLPNLEYLQTCWKAYFSKTTTFNFNLFSKKLQYLEILKN